MKEQRFEKVVEWKFQKGDGFEIVLPALIFSPFIYLLYHAFQLFGNYYFLGLSALVVLGMIVCTKLMLDIYKDEYWRLIE